MGRRGERIFKKGVKHWGGLRLADEKKEESRWESKQVTKEHKDLPRGRVDATLEFRGSQGGRKKVLT